MNCLVLGGGGFIGSHLAEALAQAGHRVRVFDRPQGAFLRLLKSCEICAGDFLDPRDLEPIGGGAGVSLNELVAQIGAVIGRAPAVEYLPARRFDVPANVLDSSLARKHLGWSAATPLAEGLRRTYEWMGRAA